MNYGSGGAGTSNHLAGELFNIVTGAKLVHVPYKGVNLAMQGVLAGEIQLVFIGIPAALPHIKAGKLRALALVAPQRSPALPEVPTVAEAGLKDFEVTTWYGVMAPAGTPRPIITRLNGELGKIMHTPDVKERLAGMATDPLTSTPEEFAAYLKQEIAKWGDVCARRTSKPTRTSRRPKRGRPCPRRDPRSASTRTPARSASRRRRRSACSARSGRSSRAARAGPWSARSRSACICRNPP